ncbi:DUF6383 domain-containing protein [uncultured Parabacteroides sp.]|uniref:DUF6383 domain-containing protein n=1 Tax=uncultured Parabacteroides sp. TaxID=512312 RepID=UPI0026026A46|nr:DUF6383 domain-containing protein [uncultured Parabacteroides sp.]
MNKRISTLMTMGLLTAGALFTTVNAQTTGEEAGTKFDGSKYYYLANENGGTYSYIGGTGVKKGNAEQYTALNTTVETNSSKVSNKDEYLWAITHVSRNGKSYFTFKNKKTGTLLSFDENGSITTAEDKGVANELTWLEKNKYVVAGEPIFAVDKSIDLSGATWSMGASGLTNICVFKQDAKTIEADKLNDALGNGFALSFPSVNPQPKENIFDQKIQAWDFTGKPWAIAMSLPGGTYFSVSTPKDGIIDEATFKASTFIAVDPVNHFGINALKRADGVGFAFKLVSGENLVMTANTSKEQVYAGNAAFTVSEMDNVNKPGEYTLKLASVRVKKDASKDDQATISNVYVDAITSTGTTYVTTTSKPTTAKCTISTSNMLKASELLKKDAPAVFNVLFVSNEKDVTETGSSEYGKYLGLRINSSAYELFAQGPDYVNLNAPQNQWVVTDVDGQKFTFTNREVNTYDAVGDATGLSFTASLRKTDEADVYEVNAESAVFTYAYVEGNSYKISSSKDLSTMSDLKIKLIPATVTPSAGYADYSDAELAELARMKFTVGSNVLYKDLFLKATYSSGVPSGVEATQEATEAAEWEVIKFDCSAAESDVAKSDTIYGSTKYAYIVKDEEIDKKDVKDIAIVSYAFKLYVDGKAYYLNETSGSYSLIQEDDVEDAPRFIVKENKNGSAYLINADTERNYNEIINKDAEGLALNDVDGSLTQESIYETAGDVKARFYVLRDVTTPSLPSIVRHASFQALTGGFVAVGEANDAVIAPTSADAENLTFWLDTANTKAYTPAFYISKGVDTTANASRLFLYNAKDSAVYYNPGTASEVKDPKYFLVDNSVKAIFRPATLTGVDTLSTVVAGAETKVTADNGLNNFKFQIVLKDAAVEGEYIIKSLSDACYIFNLNGKLGFTKDKSNALVVSVEDGIIPTSNEGINAESSISVIAGNGTITVQGAAGKMVSVTNVLGKSIANTVLTSDNATITVPAGIVVVAVEGEEAVKAVVK